MNRISAAFKKSKESGHASLLPFLCAGSPETDSLTKLLPAMQSAGASIVEIGFPYSDPIADGPTIAAAMHTALEKGITPQKIFDQVKSLRDELTIGLVAMVSVSIVVAMGGPDAFAKQASDAGFDGVIFPDLPLSETQAYREACKAHNLTMTLLISPTSPTERAIEIAKASTGFAYLLARAGVTGERADVPDISDRVRSIRKKCTIPIACGFGISTPDQVAQVVEHADGAIVGSALVRRLINAHQKNQDYVVEAELAITELATGLISMDAH
jgi:tryptophan synthase alpha chain